jgi:transcriptional regulator with XRE-family HTH domain
VAEGSPTVRRRELGAALRRLREERGMSVKQVTEHLLCSPSKVSRIETGQRGATARDVRDLCDLYGVANQTERERLMGLAREGKRQGWWQSYDLPYSSYVGFEAEAISIKDYDSAVIPGLLQTAEYARELHERAIPQKPTDELTGDVIEKRVQARLIRQRILTRTEPTPVSFSTILDEAALHRVIGSARVMQAQLRQVIELSKLPNVTVQIIPFAAGAHPGLDSTFNILEFGDRVPSLVYVEGLVGWIYLERAEDLDRYEEVFKRLSQIASTPHESVQLIDRVQARLA